MLMYEFPEIRPGVYVCNTGWISEGKVILKKINQIGVIKQILMHPPIKSWETCLDSIKLKTNLPVYQLSETEITSGSLVIYDPRDPNSVLAFETEFNCKLGVYGEITFLN